MENKEVPTEEISKETEAAFYAKQTHRSVDANETMSDKDIIIEFLDEMSKQDNRCTAWPFFYVIRTSKLVPTEEGCGDESHTVYYSTEDDSELTPEEYDELPEDEKENYHEHAMQQVWEERGMFLTEKDAELHLKNNHYHYSSDAHTYLKHIWRAPYTERFIKALFDYFEVRPNQYGEIKYAEYVEKRKAEEAEKAKQ